MAKRKEEEEDLVKGALKIGKRLAKRVTDNLKPNLLGVRVPNPLSKPKPKPAPSVSSNSKPKPKPKPAPAEVKPTKPPISASEQKTTTTRPPAQPARTESKPQTKQSSNMDDNYAAWVKANRKLAEKVKPGQAGYDSIQKALGKSSGNNDSMKIDQPASKSGSATTASSNTRFTADEEKRGSAAFNQDSVKRLPSKETAEQRRRRMARQGMA